MSVKIGAALGVGLIVLSINEHWMPVYIAVGEWKFPVAAFVKAFSAAVDPFAVPLTHFVMNTLLLPVRLLLAPFGIEWDLMDVVRSIPKGMPQLFDLPVMALGLGSLVAGYAMWATAISRTLIYAGVFNPFWKREFPRRRIAQFMVRVREAIDRLSFGRGATAKWASLFEVLAHEYRRGDILLGRPVLLGVGSMLRPIGLEPKTHFVTIAGTGAGKSSGALGPNLLTYEGSLLCIDPKGELARITAMARFERMGQDVHVLDPAGLVGRGWESACYNPFDEMAAAAAINPDSVVSFAEKIADALIRPMNETDRYWDLAPKTFLKGVILYVFFYEPSERRNLVRVRQLLTLGHVEAYKEAIAAGKIKGKDSDADEFDILLDEMRKAEDGPCGEIIAGAAKCVDKMGLNQRGGVITSADEHTNFLDYPEIRRISTSSDFLLRDLKDKPTSVYLCIPVGAARGPLGSWLRMFSMLFIDVMKRADTAPEPPILFAIDEFPSLGYLEDINSVVAVLRSFGIRFWAVAQDIEQLRTTYPKSWGGFMGNAEAVQFMGIKHRETVAYISENLGQHEVVKNQVRQEKPLLDPDQVARMLAPESGNQIIWRGAHRPMLLKITKYFEYLPPWMYDADKKFKESRVRRMWRWLMGLSS